MINKILNTNGTRVVVVLDGKKLHNYVLTNVSNELGKMSAPCYYPKINVLKQELYHLTKTNEKILKTYSKEKWKNPSWKLLHDPFTTLLVLIVQDFLRNKDAAAAISVFNLISLRYYSNLMHKQIQYCNEDYFNLALDRLSHSHLWMKKRTISGGVLHLSREVYQRFHVFLEQDNVDKIVKMVYEIRHRISQSIKSFADKYYKIAKGKESIKSVADEEEIFRKETLTNKIKTFADKISRDICVYGKIDSKASIDSLKLTKFNKKIGLSYSNTINKIDYLDDLNLLLNLMLRDTKELSNICEIRFLNHIKSLMAIKTSNKPIFFKKSLIKIHTEILSELNYTDWFNKLSAQSKATSRNYLAYYLAFTVRNYIC